jgi:hypothetical protein
MTRLVIEPGRMAPSLVALARSGKPAVTTSVRAFDQCGKERRDQGLPCGIRQDWRLSAIQGHLSPLAGAFYSVPATPSSEFAQG